jgi:hypothetical protein
MSETIGTFKISEVLEVHRDPEGHHHHFLVLVGRVFSGTLQAGDRIEIATLSGGTYQQVISGFDGFRKDLSGGASPEHGEIAVLLLNPSVKPDDVVKKGVKVVR